MLDARRGRAARAAARDAAQRRRARGGASALALDAWKIGEAVSRARPARGSATCSTCSPRARARSSIAGSNARRSRRRSASTRSSAIREPLHAGLGLRAAASRVRRGERQARAVGPRDRRHGRDHAGDGDGMRRARRRRSAPMRRCARVIVDERTRGRRRARERRDDRGARASSPTSIRSCCSSSWSTPEHARRRLPRAHRRLSLRLRHVPHERRAVRAAGFHVPARHAAAAASRHGIIIAPSLAYMERAYFDARTHGWSREPIVEMLIPSTSTIRSRRRAARREPVLPARRTRDLRRAAGRTGTTHRDEVADLMIDTVDAVRAELQRAACSAAACCRRSISSASSA